MTTRTKTLAAQRKRIPIPRTVTARVLRQLQETEPKVPEAVLVAEAWDVPDPGFSFPNGGYWQVNRDNARAWLRHQFSGLFRDSGRVGRLKALDDNELFLLRLDLLTYEARYTLYLAGQGDDPGTLETFLKAGRETWGCFDL